jgi:hypothetical protein
MFRLNSLILELWLFGLVFEIFLVFMGVTPMRKARAR